MMTGSILMINIKLIWRPSWVPYWISQRVYHFRLTDYVEHSSIQYILLYGIGWRAGFWLLLVLMPPYHNQCGDFFYVFARPSFQIFLIIVMILSFRTIGLGKQCRSWPRSDSGLHYFPFRLDALFYVTTTFYFNFRVISAIIFRCPNI